MDDTQQSRTSDAAATRKRRSSILKSQRPPRAPLSELEFHVATPTDTAKSRRVSFSRRTGVAEFVTNEATTTWKNFYEEHNKTLESSGNESEVKAPRPSVGHLGKRIFEDQFQDCEAIDFGPSSKADYNNIALDSITDDRKIPAPQQHFELSAVTATDSKLFEDNFAVSRLGEITDKIDVDFSVMQPIGDDLDEIQKDIERVVNNAPNVMCQGPAYNMSEYIEVDLNATHVGLAADDAASDDMSITDTIHSPKVNVSSITDPKDKSLDKNWDKENIAVNPYIAPKETNNFAINEESDKVLVFDGKRLTIQSEKDPLSDFRKTLLPNAQPGKTPQRKTIVLNVDDDLPNFVANPHASMMQHSQNISLSITANEEYDVSLTQPIITQPVEANIDHKQLSAHENVNMDLPLTGSGSEKRRTIVYESDSADISMTQALPSNVIFDAPNEQDVKKVLEDGIARKEKRNTIVFESGSADVSMTQAVPANIILNMKGSSKELPNNSPEKRQRRTIVFDNDAADISVTQALPANVILNSAVLPEPQKEKRKTIVFENDAADISVTQALPANVLLNSAALPEPEQKEKRKTIVFENDAADISVTQALSENVILNAAGLQKPAQTEKRKTIVFENYAADISVTQALPANVILNSAALPEPAQKDKRKTIMFENDAADISVTQALPGNVILNSAALSEPARKDKRKTIVFENDAADISVTQALSENVILNAAGLQKPAQMEKRKTIVFENDAADISVTQALPANVILNSAALPELVQKEKRKTIVFENDAADISVTQALPANVILNSAALPEPIQKDKRKTIVFDNDDADISVTQALSTKVILSAAVSQPENEKMVLEKQFVQNEKRKTVVFEDDDADISVTQALSANVIINANNLLTQDTPDKVDNIVQQEKRKTIEFDSDSADISMTRALPANFISNYAISSTQEPPNKDKTVFEENIARNEKRKTVVFDSDSGDISMTQALPTNCIIEAISSTQHPGNQRKSIVFEDNIAEKNKRKTIVFDNDAADISMTEVLPSNMILDAAAASEPEKKITANKRKTIVFDSNSADISVTQAVPANVILSAAGLSENKVFEDEAANKEKRKTVVFENDAADISITQPLPAYVISNVPGSPIQEPPSKRKTIGFNNEEANISLTQPLSVNSVITEKDQTYDVKRRTIINETYGGSISMAETVPQVKSVPEKTNITVFDKNEEDSSRRKTIPVTDVSNEMGLTYDVLPHRPSVITESNETYTVRANLDISKKEALQVNKVPSDKTTAGDEDSFNISVTQAIPSNIIFGNETRKLEAELDLSVADISVPVNLSPSGKDKETESLKKVADVSKHDFTNEQGKATEKSETSPTIATKMATEVSTSDSDVIENTEPIPKKSLPPVFAPSNDKKQPALIRQENFDAISKPVNMDATRGADIVVYQAAISGNQLGAHKNEIVYASSGDLTESGSSNDSYRDRNVVAMSESSDMEQKGFKEASQSTSAQSLSGASVPSVVDKSCSVIKIDTSPASKTKASILDSLLDMNDSLISRELLEKGLSTIDITSPVCVARATSPAQSEVFTVIREKKDVTLQSGDAEKERRDKTKNTDNESSLLTTTGKKHGTTPSPTKSPGRPSPDSAKKDSPKRNRFFESFTRHSKGKPRNQDDTADLLDLITKFADKSDYEETKKHGIKAKRDEKVKDTIKEQESPKKKSPVSQTSSAASKRPSNTRSPEKLTRQNSAAVPKRQSFIDTANLSRRSLAVRRQSIVLSREELMNNISMAAQALRRETNSPDIPEESPPSPDPEPMEVVKILNFDDDETPEHDCNSQIMASPLKKTSGDTYREETGKKTVIPSFCENVSDGVKSLMMDLIKPMADTLPFDVATDGLRDYERQTDMKSDFIPTRNVDTESDSGTSSEVLVGTLGLTKNQEYVIICDERTTGSSKSDENEVWYQLHRRAMNEEPTIVFDPDNPLNNVLFKPRYVESIHRYNPDPTPVASDIGLKLDEGQKTDNEVRFKTDETSGVKEEVYVEPRQRVTANYNVQSLIPDHKTAGVKHSETLSNKTFESKPVTTDASVITCNSTTKDQKVNTVIAMQENDTILRGNSSLTMINSSATIGAGENPKSHTDDSQKHAKHGEKHTKDSKEHSKHSGKHTKDTEKQSKDTNHSEKHNKHSEKHDKHSEKHDKHSEKHDKHSEKHDKHSEKNNKHSAKHDEHSERHDKHSDKHSKDSEKHNKKSEKHRTDIEKQSKHGEKYTTDVEKHNKHSEKLSKHSEKHARDIEKQNKEDEKHSKPGEKHNKHNEKHNKHSEKHTKDNQENVLYQPNSEKTESTETDTYKRKHSPSKKIPESHFYTSSPLNDLPTNISFIHENLEEKFTHERSPAHKKLKCSTPNSQKKSPKSDVDRSRNIKEIDSKKTVIVKPNTQVTVNHCAILNSVNSSEPNIPQEGIVVKSETSLSSKSGSLETLSHSSSRPQLESKYDCKAEEDVDVCDTIRNLRCMSSPEACVWEKATSEEWRFLLLHGRLTLVVTLSPAHRGTDIRADTPVTSVDLLVEPAEKKSTVREELCVRFLRESIRHFITEHTCSVAGELPSLVRRSGAAAGAALRWTRLMDTAWGHLAYHLDCDGLLTLTVANFDMQHVWLVSMKIEMSHEGYVAPFPRASDVQVDNIFGEYDVNDEVQSLIKDMRTGWGHAPAVIWEIFEYLKHKTLDNDLI